ncbi:hypothetical protein BDV28DRAFT_133145 [Aspergillus coremiiformis]|uniref:Uncharacterized protein n=1 Tax=Aspergillus coremiiformis TaxID=138285 RepID=A0A5N6Z972_9EURO|nr:hypothetical protein BDV28DRAFT_133145 [Aspergillus coremiiformis]
MRDMPSKFIEILDPEDPHFRTSDADVRLEDVLADQEAVARRPRASTQSSTKAGLDKDRIYRGGQSPSQQRWKRLSMILVPVRRGSS